MTATDGSYLSYETEAIPSAALRAMVREAITGLMDQRVHELNLMVEKQERAGLLGLRERFGGDR